MYCKNCGTNVPDGNPFCPTCGNPMPAPAQTASTCPSCGAPLAPGVKFCGTCGAPLPQSQPVQAQPSADPYAGGYDASPYTKPNAGSNKKTFIIIGAAVAVIAVIAVILVLVLGGGSGSGGSPEAVAEDFMNCIFSGDVDDAFELVPEKVMDSAEGDLDDLADELEPFYEQMDELGVKISVKATDSESLDDDEIEDLEEMYEDELDVKLKISDAQTVELEMTAKIDGEKETVDVSMVVIEVDGDWYVDVISMAESFEDMM